MIAFSSKHRSEEKEIMDDFQFQGTEMEALLTDLKRINKWLGGNKITLNGIQKLVEAGPGNRRISILDIGCGDGEMLRVCANKLKQPNITFSYTGIDANKFIIDEAILRNKDYPNIQFKTMDVFSREFEDLEYDIALCTLFLHHFKDKDIRRLVEKIASNAKVGIVINDLERSKLAFVLFKIVSTLFVRTKTARNDGLVSIARAFKRKELIAFSKSVKAEHFIKWKWAFRYQWIIKRV
ncbi:MAG: methyltransferase domain-containing protein [Bacteroidia bacterium]|nr:methyltransferase domain-containing protein [Bacteroidia bacterium]NNF31400.1 methyltransferase domain-containing protein [Flavobacteriaceae bacterium]MBT8275933.1 methyltransferase domain-containing protein [Bacteroidia bacterium]NNJ81235.1 methyltransferase domain-containing protein [Flavobacteriaceae bacterium]NNK53008.1 methyltransferase domain-containing protein [Flavobacteriaceae bacterium]